ncbi:AraC family transcriptional regulator [Arcobacter sp. FW59]|nr:AraC family transcriptional regulator [Arcobacter sp. FW59]
MNNDLKNLSICKYIQYQEQQKKEVFISTNILIFVIKGTKILHLNDDKIVVNPNEVIFLRSGYYVISEILDEYFESILFMYDDTILLDFIQKYDLNFENIFSFDYKYFKIKKTSIFEIFQASVLSYLVENSSNKDYLIKLKLEEVFFNILESDSKEYFKIFLSSIYNEYFFKIKIEKEFNINENILLFAKKLNMTDLAFRKKFKTIFGTTPKKWQIEKRFEKAKLLLETTNYNVTEVCYKSGFENISWFIQTFKKRYNITPKQIKNNKN